MFLLSPEYCSMRFYFNYFYDDDLHTVVMIPVV